MQQWYEGERRRGSRDRRDPFFIPVFFFFCFVCIAKRALSSISILLFVFSPTRSVDGLCVDIQLQRDKIFVRQLVTCQRDKIFVHQLVTCQRDKIFVRQLVTCQRDKIFVRQLVTCQ